MTVPGDCACPPSALKKITPIAAIPCGTLIGPGITSVTVTVTDCNGVSATKLIPLTIINSFLGALTNTGISLSGALLAENAIDPHYTPLGPVAGVPPGYIAPDALVVTNVWAWLEVAHVSQWIAPNTYNPPGYQLAFDG